MWDALTFTLIFALAFLSAYIVRDALVWAVATLACVAYACCLGVTAGQTKAGGYVWYLARKTQVSRSAWTDYWFWKFRFWLVRYLRRIAPRGGRDLFVKQHVRRFAEARGETIPPGDLPALKDLEREIRQHGYDLRLLKSEKRATAGMVEDVGVLEDYISESETYHEAVLKYAANLYLNLDPVDRELVRLESGEGAWARLTRDPVASRILLEVLGPVLAAIAAVIVVHYLG